MTRSSAKRSKHGVFTLEWLFGLIVLIPIMLIVVDLCVIYAGISFNNQVCREAARNAASGPPDVVCAKSPRSRAKSVIERANKGSAFKIDPECDVSEKITAMPSNGTGGPVGGFTTVSSVVNVHPPFGVSKFFGKDSLRFTASETFPITYVMSTSEKQVQNITSDDGWLVNMSLMRLDHYLDYNGSSMPNFSKMCIFYSKLTENKAPVSVHYEDLLYSGNHAVGCNEFHSLDLPGSTTGVVYLTTQSPAVMTPDEGYAAGNAVGRLFLDLFEKGCVIRQVVVPLDSYGAIIQGFCLSGFMEESNMPNGTIPKLILRVVSQPSGQIEEVIVP
jgi:hypothetical protein